MTTAAATPARRRTDAPAVSPAAAPARLRDWQSRLADCIARRRELPFAWGKLDCALFAADCVAAVTGVDPAADLRAAYRSEREAARLVARFGGLAALAASRLGPEVLPGQARAGDVGLVPAPARRAPASAAARAGLVTEQLAVCGGPCWVAPGETGLVVVDRATVLRAWRASAAG